MRMIVSALFSAGLVLAAPALSREMIGNWVVDHFKPFGLWESMCDHRREDGDEIRRCYIRYIDGYAPNPKFGAAFVFVTAPQSGELRYEFGFEPGTKFASGGFVITRDGKTVWRHDTTLCEGGNTCIFENGDAERITALLSDGGSLVFTFADRHHRKWERIWSAPDYAEVLADFRAASTERGLP